MSRRLGDLGQRLGQLGLPHAGRAFDEHGSAHALGEEDDGADPAIGDVPGVLEMLLDVLDRSRTWRLLSRELAHSLAHRPERLVSGPGRLDTGGTHATNERAQRYHRWQFWLSIAGLVLAAAYLLRSHRDGRGGHASGLALVRQSALVDPASPGAHRPGRRSTALVSLPLALARGLLAAAPLRALAPAVSSLALGRRQGRRDRRRPRPAGRNDRLRIPARHALVVALERRHLLRRLRAC